MSKSKYIKKLTRSGRYRYYTSQGKRVSKSLYYSYLKRGLSFKKEKFSGRFNDGFNYIRKLNYLVLPGDHEGVFKKIEEAFSKFKRRLKDKNKKMYLGFKAEGLLGGGDKTEKEGYTRISFVNEYLKNDFRHEEIKSLTGYILALIDSIDNDFPLLNQVTNEEEEIISIKLKQILINIRK